MNGERREVSETRNTGRSGQGSEVSGCAWDIGTRLCSSKGDGVCSLSTPLPTPPPRELQTGGRLALDGGKEGAVESPLRAGTLSILMSPMSLLVRGVKKEDKALAVGIQFMLLRVLGKEPAVCWAWGHRDE